MQCSTCFVEMVQFSVVKCINKQARYCVVPCRLYVRRSVKMSELIEHLMILMQLATHCGIFFYFCCDCLCINEFVICEVHTHYRFAFNYYISYFLRLFPIILIAFARRAGVRARTLSSRCFPSLMSFVFIAIFNIICSSDWH